MGGVSAAAPTVLESLGASRLDGQHALALRLQRAIENGDFVDRTDLAALALYFMAGTEGHAIQAAAGATREDFGHSLGSR